MKILITFAVDDEFAPWRKMRSFQRPKLGMDADAYTADINGLQVCALLTGVGCEKAWVDATKLIWNLDVDMCISSGLAGGLKPGRMLGEVVVARQVESASWKRRIHCDGEMVDVALHCGAKEVPLLYSTDHIVTNASEKNELGQIADAVDMESGAVLYEAAAFGARVVAVRAISDSYDEDLPIDFNRVVTKKGDVSIPRVLGEVARRPTVLPSLVRFGRQSKAAAEKLAVVLDRYIECLADLKTVPTEKAAS